MLTMFVQSFIQIQMPIKEEKGYLKTSLQTYAAITLRLLLLVVVVVEFS